MGQSNLIDESSSSGKEQLVCQSQRLSQPNGLAFSYRERAARDHVKIARISRAAVSWYAVLGGVVQMVSGQGG